MTPTALRDTVVQALEDLKGRDVVALDVSHVTDVMDFMVIASGTSNRHVKALVDSVVESSKERGVRPMGIEGRETAEWVLVDLGDVVVHVMQPRAREFYDLERLWDVPAAGQSVI
ncbi:MAG: ribosome silencing factor [Gammaproteobacteria bacterium]|jgi:ribosome-associated protein